MDAESVTRGAWPAAPSAARFPKELAIVVGAFIASRAMVAAVILLSRLQLPPGHFWHEGGLLAVLTGGGAARYLEHAASERWFAFGPGAETTAFFPVFPVLVKLASFLLSPAVAGVAIANLSLLAAGVLLHRFVRMEYDDARISRTAVMLLLFSPASFFFSCAVPDSTALMLAVASLIAAVKGRWLAACLCGLLLCATMSAGFCIIVPLFVEYARQHGREGFAGLLRPATLLLVPLLAALIAAVAVGYTRFQDPFALLEVSATTEKTMRSLLAVSNYFKGYAAFHEWLFRGAVIATVILGITGYVLKLRLSLLAFIIAVAAVCVLSHDLQAPRTLALAFPLYAVGGLLARRFDWMYDALLTSSMVLLALGTIAAANGFWLS